MSLRRTCLYAEHVELGARLVDFGGWEMPLAYRDGTIAEHLACRSDSAVFDVSHLGTVRVEGPGSLQLLQTNLTNDLNRIGPGHAQYQHLLDETDASVLDDLIVWWVSDESFDVMPNASNTDRVISVLGGEDVTGERAVIAVQGPRARERLATVAPEAAAVGHFAVGGFEFGGSRCRVAGTGYTGEDGVECAVPVGRCSRILACRRRRRRPAGGLGARDTLRLEAGLPLHGHELGPGITPLQAGLGWVVSWDKGPFRGREPLEAERISGPWRRLRGLLAEGRRPPRAKDAVLVGGESRARSRAATSLPCCSGGSRSPSYLLGSASAQRWTSHCGGRAPATVVKPPFQRLQPATESQPRTPPPAGGPSGTDSNPTERKRS